MGPKAGRDDVRDLYTAAHRCIVSLDGVMSDCQDTAKYFPKLVRVQPSVRDFANVYSNPPVCRSVEQIGDTD